MPRKPRLAACCGVDRPAALGRRRSVDSMSKIGRLERPELEPGGRRAASSRGCRSRQRGEARRAGCGRRRPVRRVRNVTSSWPFGRRSTAMMPPIQPTATRARASASRSIWRSTRTARRHAVVGDPPGGTLSMLVGDGDGRAARSASLDDDRDRGRRSAVEIADARSARRDDHRQGHEETVEAGTAGCATGRGIRAGRRSRRSAGAGRGGPSGRCSLVDERRVDSGTSRLATDGRRAR